MRYSLHIIVKQIWRFKKYAATISTILCLLLFSARLFAQTVTQTWATVGTSPNGIAIDAAGNVYTANSGDNTVSKITPSGTVTKAWATVGNFPAAIAIDASGNVYTANYNDNTVSKITPSGTVTKAWAAVGSGPMGMAIDVAGNVYTANSLDNTVSKITPSGTVTKAWAAVGKNPDGIAIDAAENIYTANFLDVTVSRITPSGTVTKAWATVDDGPRGIAIDAAGNVYTVNSGDGTVDKITASGTVTQLGVVGFYPTGIAIDATGNVYTANSQSNTVSKITPPPIAPDANGILYVDSAAAAGGTGSSWATAIDSLNIALNAAQTINANATSSADSVKQIWVSKGTYRPEADSSFFMLPKVKIYGGFLGTETSLSQRPPVSPSGGPQGAGADASILKGNNNRVITNNNNGLDTSAALDGFVITGGAANGGVEMSGNGGGIYNSYSSPVLSNVIITENRAEYFGGGVYNRRGSSPVLTNVSISGNNAAWGGGIYDSSSSPVLTNVTITGNTALFGYGSGGGVYNLSSSPVLTNVTISGNSAGVVGGGIYNGSSSSPQIRNSIIYDNSTGIDNDNTSIPLVQYSLVQGLPGGTNGNIDGSLDPKFVSPVAFGSAPTMAGDYRLQAGSPAINAGVNDSIPSWDSTDLAGNSRIYNLANGGIVDMGAFEFQGNPIRPTNGILYVDSAAAAGGNGSSWATAIDSLNIALNAAKMINANATSSVDSVGQIWVAKGTYQPEADSTFFMLPKVKIYGGFLGTETSLSQRPPVSPSGGSQGAGADASILKGNNNRVITNNNNGLDTSAVLDGFTITGGGSNFGGGIYNYRASPMLSNLNVYSSVANQSGGGVYDTLSSPVVTNVIISYNMGQAGGGIYNASSSPVMTNVELFNNSNVAGTVFNTESTPAMNNVTISGNMGGGIYNTNSSTAKLTNSIIWNNVSSNGGYEISNDATSATNLDHSLYSNASGADSGSVTATNSVTSDPMFENPAAYNFQLQAISPAINAGNNALIPGWDSTDLAGNSRIYNLANGGIVDIGAFEFQGNPFRPKPDANGILYVDSAAAAGGNGSSWANAIDSLNIALSAAQYINANATSSADSVKQIWVSKGTYQPEADSSFFMLPKVKIYGGFLGTETSLSQHPPMSPSGGPQGAGAVSILKGNNNSVIINNHNGLDTTAVLDGFTITGGYGHGNSTITKGDGGGIFNSHVSPTLANLVINNNAAASGGGGISNEDSSFSIMNHITISGNTAGNGGGILNVSSSPVVTDAVISSDSAYEGGGIYNNASSPVLTNVIISGNKANGNCGNGSGGGIFNMGSQSGGQSYVFSPVLTNVTIVGNTANLNGGGISSSANNTPSSITMTNCILWNNTALGSGNDIYSDGGAAAHISYSYTQTAQSGTGNITGSSDPFVNLTKPAGQDGFFGTIHDGLELKSGSSAINAGDPRTNAAGYPVQAGNTDITGNSRIIDGRIDMGAYEHQDSALITAQPKDTTACAGSNVSFNISAAGSNISYQWQSSADAGKSWLNVAGATGDTLKLSDVQISDSGSQYRAIVAGLLNADTSAIAVLHANMPVSIIMPPKDITVNLGNNASFSVAATGDVTGYQWQSSADGTGWNNIAGATNAVLELSNVASSLNGMHYRVSVSGACGIIYSNGAILTVNTPVTITITTQPSNQTVNSGANATFNVTATGIGTSLSYQWQSSTDGTHWNNITAGTSGTLELSNVQSSDNGTQYRAIITGIGITDTSNISTLTVNTPVIITSQPANVTACIGSHVNFVVTATGTGLSYQWQSSADGTHWNNETAGTAETLELSNVQTSDNGVRYRVLVSANGMSVISDAASLTVSPLPVITIVADNANPVSKGLLVHLTASGAQDYQWNGNPGIRSGLGDSVISVQPEQNENFTVTGTTAAGCVSSRTYAMQVVEDFKLTCNNILTPNGDGINDFWVIQNINSYPDNKVMIFDQSGREVYEKENYDNTWNGTNNGRPLLEGTYYYIFIAHGTNGKQKVFKGFIELLNGRR